MKTVGWLTLSSLLLLGCAESKESPPEPTRAAQCEALRDHLVELRLESVDVDREQHTRAHREALGAAFLTDCERDQDETSLACALSASDPTSLANCLAKDVQP